MAENRYTNGAEELEEDGDILSGDSFSAGKKPRKPKSGFIDIRPTPRDSSTKQPSPLQRPQRPSILDQMNQDRTVQAIESLMGQQQGPRMRPLPPILETVGPIGQTLTRGDVLTEKQIKPTPARKATISAAKPLSPIQEIRRFGLGLPVFGEFAQGIGEGSAMALSTASGASSLLGDIASKIRPYVEGGNERSAFYDLADWFSKLSQEQLLELETLTPVKTDIARGEAPIESIANVAGQVVPQLGFQGGLMKALGFAGRGAFPLTFGAQKMFDARQRGITDPGELTTQGLVGAAEGAVFNRLNQMPFGPARLTTQTLAGGAQEFVDAPLQGREIKAEGVFKSALTNVAFDLITPPSGEGRPLLPKDFTFEIGPDSKPLFTFTRGRGGESFMGSPNTMERVSPLSTLYIGLDPRLISEYLPRPETIKALFPSIFKRRVSTEVESATNQDFDVLQQDLFKRVSTKVDAQLAGSYKAFQLAMKNPPDIFSIPYSFRHTKLEAILDDVGVSTLNFEDYFPDYKFKFVVDINRPDATEVNLVYLPSGETVASANTFSGTSLIRKGVEDSIRRNPVSEEDVRRGYVRGDKAAFVRHQYASVTPKAHLAEIYESNKLELQDTKSKLETRIVEFVQRKRQEALSRADAAIPTENLDTRITDEPQGIIIHNISQDKLAQLISGASGDPSQVASPNPSIAVIHPEADFSGYGEISLIGTPDIISQEIPGVGTDIFPTDFYTPTVGEALLGADAWLNTPALSSEAVPEVSAKMSRLRAGQMESRLSNPDLVFNNAALFAAYAKSGGAFPDVSAFEEGLGQLNRTATQSSSMPEFKATRQAQDNFIQDKELFREDITDLLQKSGPKTESSNNWDKANAAARAVDQYLLVTLSKPELPPVETLRSGIESALRSSDVGPEFVSQLSESITKLAETSAVTFKLFKEAPVGYMEAQPQRPVKLTEYVAALVPVNRTRAESTGWETVGGDREANFDQIAQQLQAAGLRVYRYKTPAEKIEYQKALAQFRDIAAKPSSSYGALYSNPIFDPEQFKKLFSVFSRRQQQKAESEQVARDFAREVEARKTPEQTQAQTIIEASTKLEKDQLELAARRFEETKAARKAARDKLKQLRVLKENPQYLNSESQAKLNAEITKAEAEYQKAYEAARPEGQRFRGAREVYAQAEQERIQSRAQARLADPDVSYRVDPDIPYLDEVQTLPVSKSFLKVAKDVVDSEGIRLDPDELVVDQVIDLALQNRLPLDQLLPVLEKNGLSLDGFLGDLRSSVERSARLLGYLSHIRRSQDYLDKIAKINPDLAKVLQMKLPSVKDLYPYLRERSLLSRLAGVNQGLLTSLFQTAANNLVSAGVRTGMDSMGQIFDSVVQRLGANRGIKNPLSPVMALRPFFMLLSEAVGQPIYRARVKASALRGKQSNAQMPAASRFFKELEKAFPKELFSVGEITHADAEAGQAALILLQNFKTQAQAFPGNSKRKQQVLAAIANAEQITRGKQRPLQKLMTGAERVTAILSWANVAQERIARKAIFEAKLRRFAAESGIDIDGAITDGRLASVLPVELVTRAADEALRLTYGTKRLKNGLFGNETADALIKLGGLPFPNFAINFLIDQVESSPAGMLKVFSARERDKIARGDLRAFWQPLMGIGIYMAFSSMRAAYYDSEEKKEPKESRRGGPNWYEVRLGNRMIDIRNTPWAPTAYVADIVEREKRGLIDTSDISFKEAAQTLSGLSTRNVELIPDAVTDAIKGLQDPASAEKSQVLAGKYLGGQLATFLTPLRQLSDIASTFDPKEAIRRENVDDGFLPTVGSQLQERIPFLKQRLPEYESPTRKEPPSRPSPLMTQLSGIRTSMEPTFIEREIANKAISPRIYQQTTGIPKVDRRMREVLGAMMQELGDNLEQDPDYKNLNPREQALVLTAQILPRMAAISAKVVLAEFPEEAIQRKIKASIPKRARILINQDRKLSGLPQIEEGQEDEVKRPK